MRKIAIVASFCLCLSSAFAQSKSNAQPTKASVLNAIEKAERATHAYQETQVTYRDLPAVAATFDNDAGVVVTATFAMATVKLGLNADKSELDGFSLVADFANEDAAAVNSGLTATTL